MKAKRGIVFVFAVASVVCLWTALCMANEWRVDGETATNEVTIEGVTLGDETSQQFSIRWAIPEPEGLPVRIVRVGEVKCLDGASAFDPFVVVGDVGHDAGTVRFVGSLFSYRRTIRLRASVITEKQREGRWYPHEVLQCRELKLNVVPGPERENPPWSPTIGVVHTQPWATTAAKIDVRRGESFTWRSAEWLYSQPLGGQDKPEVTISRIKPFHPHATEDLFPTVAAERLPDGTGLAITPGNLRPFERYAIKLDIGETRLIYVRTVD